MANEFKIKTGLLLGPPFSTQPVTSIQDNSTAIVSDASSILVTGRAVHDYVVGEVHNLEIASNARNDNQDSSIIDLRGWNTTIDASIDYVKNLDIIQDASIVSIRGWNTTIDASIVGLRSYVDGSFGTVKAWNLDQDASIVLLKNWNISSDASITYLREVNTTQDASIIGLRTYVDGSFGTIKAWNLDQDASITAIKLLNTTQDASIVGLRGWSVVLDASVVTLKSTNVTQDASIVGLRSYIDGSLATLQIWNTNLDASIIDIRSLDIIQDASIVRIDASLNDTIDSLTIFYDQTYIDSSLNVINSRLNDQDTSILVLNSIEIAQDASLTFLRGWDADQDASIISIKALNAIQDASLTLLRNWDRALDASVINMRALDVIQDASLTLFRVWDTAIDASVGVINTSIGNLVVWNKSLDASVIGIRTWNTAIDASVVAIRSLNTSQDASLTLLRTWDTALDASVVALRSVNVTQDASITGLRDYVDGSFGTIKSWNLDQDASIIGIKALNITQDSSIIDLRVWNAAIDASIIYIKNLDIIQDASLTLLRTWDTVLDASVVALRAVNTTQDASIVGLRTYVDGSFGVFKNWDQSQDSSIVAIKSLDTLQDASILRLKTVMRQYFSSGLLQGGTLSINTNPSTFDISAGFGYIVDSHTDPLHPLEYDVSWGKITGITPQYLLTNPASYISLDKNLNIIQSPTPPDPTGRRDYLYLGAIVHSNNVIINTVNNLPVIALDLGAQVADLMYALGFWSISGNLITANDGGLQFDKSAGTAFKPGANFNILRSNPHIITLPQQIAATFRYRNQNSSEGLDVSTLDPTTWDQNGVTTAVGGSSSATTIQRVYIFSSGLIRVQRGQEVFATFADAMSRAGSESFVTEANISQNGLYLASIVIKKTCTNLSNTAEAIIIPASGIKSSGTSSSFATLQQSYDISPTFPSPQIIGGMGIDGSLYLYNHVIHGVSNPEDSSDAVNRYFFDASLSVRDSRLSDIDSSIINIKSLDITQDASIVSLRSWEVDQDASIVAIGALNVIQDASLVRFKVWNTALDASVIAIRALNVTQDASLTAMRTLNTAQDASITAIRTLNTAQDASITAIRNLDITQDASISNLRVWNTAIDASVISIKTVLVDQAADISGIKTVNIAQDASIGLEKQKWIDINRCGFVNESDVSLLFNDTNYVFQMVRTGSTWKYFRAGIEYTFTTDPSILIGSPPVKGLNYIVIDNNNGTLAVSQSQWTLMDSTLPVATVLWDASATPKFQFAEEKHQALLDRRIHAYLHFSRGTQYINGGSLSGPTLNGTTNYTNTFGVSQTTIADEDMFEYLPELIRPDGSSNDYLVFFRTSSSTWTWEESSVPYRYTGGSNLIQWDNNGTMTTAANGNGNFYNWYLLYTNFYGKGRYALIPGRGIFASVALAQAEDPKTFDMTGYPIAESVIAYQFTWETRGGQTNLGKVRLAANPKKINVTTITSVGSIAGMDHNSLSGLLGGADYYHLSTDQYNDWVGKSYVDGSLATRDSSISFLFNWNNRLDSSIGSLVDKNSDQDASIVNLITWNTALDASVGVINTSIGNLVSWNSDQDASFASIRALNITQDASLTFLRGWNTDIDASIVSIKSANITQDASISALRVWDAALDASVIAIRALNVTQDASLTAMRTLNTAQDASLTAMRILNTAQDASIVALRTWDTAQDASIGVINTSIGNLVTWNKAIDVSIGVINTSIGNLVIWDRAIDASIGVINTSIGILRTWNTALDASISAIRAIDVIQDSSIISLRGWNTDIDASIVGLRTYVDGSLSLKVNKVGDTMTGPLYVDEGGGFRIKYSGNRIDFNRAGANYIWCTSVGGYFLFGVNGDSAASPADVASMVITTAKRVGLSNPSPSYTLDVSGYINATQDVLVNGRGLRSWDITIDASIVALRATNVTQDASIVALRATNASTFLSLSDTPSSYSAGKMVVVNDASTGLEFAPRIWRESTNIVTLDNNSANVYFYDYIELEADGGEATVIEKQVTSSSAIGTEESYTFNLDNHQMLKVYGLSDGAGDVSTSRGVAVLDYFYIGDPGSAPAASKCWRLFIDDVSNHLIVQKRETSGAWTEKGRFF